MKSFRDKVLSFGVLEAVHLVALLVTHVTLAVLEGPLGTRHLATLVGTGLNSDIIADASQLAAGGTYQ